ncbi:MAG: AMP-binding protein, partial [Bacteroidetes bacterium]|nr:AMP-binding protein [Bacteroidota bacterium]
MQHPTRLFDFAYYQKEHYNLSHAFVDKVDGQWKATSITEFIEKGNAISRALLRLDIALNDKIGLISMTNRSEWNICDLGILQVGAQDIPIYPTSTKEDYQYILNHSESVICFVSCREVYDKISAIRDQVPTLKYIYSVDVLDDCPHWSELLTLGDDQSNQDQVDQIMARVGQDDLATIIYTSGTTGKPKGVMLSHQNISANIVRSADRLPLDLGHSKALSFLPVCHIYERMLSYMYQYCGIEIYFAESLETISANLQEIHPDVMTAVP